MPKDAEFLKLQREAYEAVLKALSVVKLDWSKQKLLAELRKHLNISQSSNVALLEKVLSDPEVKACKGDVEGDGSLREALNEAGRVGAGRIPPRVVYHSENETDTEADEDFEKDPEEEEEEESYSEGSTRPLRDQRQRIRHRPKQQHTKKRPQQTKKRKGNKKVRSLEQESPGSDSHIDFNPLSRDEVAQYEMQPHNPSTGGNGTRFGLSQLKPPYDNDAFEGYLVAGTIEELREMHRQIKKRRSALINVMLENDDLTHFPDNDLVQKILLREKNARQEKALLHELSLLDN